MQKNQEFYKNRRRIRPDGKAKVTGSLSYLTDLSFSNMLYGKILRSSYPHAIIKSINTDHAEKLYGVKAIITHKDIPGLNRFGIVTPDQPVLCEEHVRYVGDAIAAVAAVSVEIAEKALELIKVEYEVLPILDSPEKSLEKDAPKLHPEGNILHKAGFKTGDMEAGFAKAAAIVEETYQVPRQMHAYMETEGGVIVPEKDGAITVYVGTQHGYKDRFQLSRILDIPEEKIRIVSSPMGGSFGGKDELNIQPYGAVLALVSGCPVKIHQTRKESLIAGLKRHPMKITMKTGVDSEGRILANQVNIIADTGAYATLGPAILDFSVEHAAGPYMIPNMVTEGISVFTNNGVSGEFRGFGGNQVTFALEGQIDRLAEKIGMDPNELRRRNIRKVDDPGPLGHRIAPTNGAYEVLEAINKKLTIKTNQLKDSPPNDKWKVRGIGTAITMHGGGLGYGRLDPAGGRISLSEKGKIEIAFGFEEAGQGILGVIETIVTEELGCAPEDLSIVIGDTALVPSSGSTTASRGTSMVWHALQRMKGAFEQQILNKASAITSVSVSQMQLGRGGVFSITKANSYALLLTYDEIAKQINENETIVVSTNFDFPTTPDPVDGGHFLYTFGAVLAQVEIDLLTGKVKVIDLDQSIAAGPVVSTMGYIGQIEGGGVMSLGYTLMEDALMEGGKYITENLDSYLIPSILDVPFSMDTEAIEQLVEGDPYGPRGVGEIGTVAVAPAIAKAIHHAIGYWPTRLPISSEEILFASSQRRQRQWIKVRQ
ncbi:xanthine dehydrogenase subunit D [Aquibacillus rhizosphaerae]|uniref:Xanthine dehydrogenase subunit D n=1 Tax=Aquibacillus rhizosphaerae TaxID=3051431 RepID=A0ABT7L8V6_9BACI|nr:xanthine dehydrogenase subunit D [Aquibacillus sp. LR5S19]MDL4841011.1 xanthine dehydrogenase subunit D [Aquibacillus sp. LR5S19]